MTEIEKPPYGSPCNNCGQCCQDQLCFIASMIVSGQTQIPIRMRCPFLTKDNFCGVVDAISKEYPLFDKSDISWAIGSIIGFGLGCDAILVSEHVDPQLRIDFLSKIDKEEQRRAFEFLTKAGIL